MATSWPPMETRGPNVTSSAVATLEARLGTKLPDDYAEFLLDVNGGEPAQSHCVFTLRFRSGRTNETMLGSLDSLDDPNESCDLTRHWERTREWLPKEALPIGSDGFGGLVLLVVAGPRRGQVWYLDTENLRDEGSNPRVEWFDRRDVARVADSFREFATSLKPASS